MQKYIAVIKRYIAAICREIWLSFLKIITVMLSLVQDVFLSNDKPDLYLAVQCTCTVYMLSRDNSTVRNVLECSPEMNVSAVILSILGGQKEFS